VQFQASLALLDRMSMNRGLSTDAVATAVRSLLDLEPGAEGYESRIARWLRDDLAAALPDPGADVPDSLEAGILAAMSGSHSSGGDAPIVRIEGHEYRADLAAGELRRLRRIRERQDSVPLDEAAERVLAPQGTGHRARATSDRLLADTLASVVYAAYLGDPDGPAMSGGNVAARHDLGLTADLPGRPAAVWQIAVEEFGGRAGWRLKGSLLGLDAALSRLALRRLDDGTMPVEPRLSRSDREAASETVAMLNGRAMTDAARNEIAAALARGRARLASVTADRDEIDRLARDAGLSEWRRESLAWAVVHEPERVPRLLTRLELFWLGAPRPSEAAPLDPWGAALLPLTGCLCLGMPHPRPWEELAGRPASGVMAVRAVDVSLLVAETLHDLDLPAALAQGLVAYAMQDVLDRAQPAFLDDWFAISEVTTAITRERLEDYIAALAAAGPLVPRARADRVSPAP
jgi:hypothetical protein